MADAGHNLKIKYGLRGDPSDQLISKWVAEVTRLKNAGFSSEDAGSRAAAAVFPDFQTHFYASVADDIESLLDAARNR